MRILLYNGKMLSKMVLPSKIDGSFWIVDEINKTNLASVEAINGRWVMKSNEDVKINFNNSYVQELPISPNTFATVETSDRKYFLSMESVTDNSSGFYKLQNSSISLGMDVACDIVYGNPYIFNNYLALSFNENGWNIQIADNAMVYVNDILLTQKNKNLDYGDVIFVFGLRIVLLYGVISVNNPLGNLRMNGDKFLMINFKDNFNFGAQVEDSESIKEIDYYKEDNYFYKKARMRRFIETYELQISPPPGKQSKQETPAWLVLGPQLTMAIMSGMNVFRNVEKIMSGETTFEESYMSFLSPILMLTTSLLWPNITRAYQKAASKRREKERQKKYKKYMEKKKQELLEVVDTQTKILKDNLISVAECESIILNRKISLWERRSDQKDFLTVRVGTGNVPLDVKMNFEAQDFTMEEDELRKVAEDTFLELKTLYNMPVSYSFNNKRVTALMGSDNEIFTFVDNLLLQLLTFHSYDDLKIIFLTSKKNLDVWSKYKNLPHCFSNNKQIRFFATDMDNIKQVSAYLQEEFIQRATNRENTDAVANENKETSYTPSYLIITDDYPLIRKVGIIENILKCKVNLGFNILCIENRLSRIPSECSNFISISKNSSTILCTDIENYSQQMFNMELNNTVRTNDCFKVLENIPIEFIEDIRSLPTVYGFLEMFEVGKVEQLNSLNRWRMNDPIKSLRARVGVNDEGGPIYLDLHEKYHGPHGLIAGMTGSGKSEFIITYILSMALNYSPNEVAFILIDYKGGGLAGAFENKTQGLRLPHLAGTITNLDKSSLNRTLVSIESELKRRQAKFNEERDKLGESTIDIYKYQRLFREGKIKDPMPHLFIISDEFAELKSQQPEFMADLISAARIGRSLGVHLILATQKPSGVVNDQIWSNTKFRVCLKVQDTSDSNEMLKQPDAAYLTNAGRFFLQVGSNEIFVLGQSGWAGAQYNASDTVKKKYDRSVSFIDDIGGVIKNLSDTSEKKVSSKDNGDELSNVLRYICNLAEKENLRTKNLWLDSMPVVSYVEDTMKRYNYQVPSVVTAVIGEYDAPAEQYQNILTIPMDEEGNTLIYSTSSTDRELFLSTFIYSICINHSPDDVNLYIVDYGSETFRLYEKFPQVGDVVYPSEEDKLQKLMSLISGEITARKKLFADYNGEFKIYNKNSGKKVPLKIVLINNYDSFKESHEGLGEHIYKITREGERYGIIFVLAANNYRSVYNKLILNFHHTFVINMENKGDYSDILGRIGNIWPSNTEGRGLVKTNGIYEFQTSHIADEDNLVDFVYNKIKEVSKLYKNKAPNIPSLPDVVTVEMLDKEVKDINSLPIGILKKNLKVCNYNFFADKATIISAKDVGKTVDLLKTIIYGVRKLNQMIVLIDTEQELASIGGMVNTYVDKNFEEFILRFENFLDTEIDGKNIKVLCVIAGLEKFQGSMNDKKFNGFFNGIKTLENVNLVFVDSSHKLKKVQFEQWFSSVTNSSNGIWVGPGFTEQSVFKCDTYGAQYKVKINEQFAWVSKNSEADLVKIVGEPKEDEE